MYREINLKKIMEDKLLILMKLIIIRIRHMIRKQTQEGFRKDKMMIKNKLKFQNEITLANQFKIH